MSRNASAVILKITYGYTVAESNDWYVALADAAVQPLSRAAIFGTYMVDYLPFLKYIPSWMPGAAFKREAREWRRLARDVRECPFQIVKEKMVIRATISIFSQKLTESSGWWNSNIMHSNERTWEMYGVRPGRGPRRRDKEHNRHRLCRWVITWNTRSHWYLNLIAGADTVSDWCLKGIDQASHHAPHRQFPQYRHSFWPWFIFPTFRRELRMKSIMLLAAIGCHLLRINRRCHISHILYGSVCAGILSPL